MRPTTTSYPSLDPAVGPGDCFLPISPAHVLICFSNQGVRYRVEDVVLDAQAMARRGTKIGEESFSAYLFHFIAQVEMQPGAAKVLPQGLAGA